MSGVLNLGLQILDQVISLRFAYFSTAYVRARLSKLACFWIRQ